MRIKLWTPILAAVAVLAFVVSLSGPPDTTSRVTSVAEPDRTDVFDGSRPEGARELDEVANAQKRPDPLPEADAGRQARQPASVAPAQRHYRAHLDSMPGSNARQDTALSTLECTFVLDPGVPEDVYDAVLVLPDGRLRRRHGIESGRRIRFDHLESGYVSLVVELAQSGYEIERIEGIALPHASTTNDARLETIDLRGRVHGLRARLLDSSGEPLALADVRIDDGRGHASKSMTNDAGWFSVFVPSAINALDLKVNGFHPATFHSLDTLQLGRTD